MEENILFKVVFMAFILSWVNKITLLILKEFINISNFFIKNKEVEKLKEEKLLLKKVNELVNR